MIRRSGPRTARIAELLARPVAASFDETALAVCAYADGRGHPLAFARSTFGQLANLHGDKAVWKLMDHYGSAVVDVPIDGPLPPDVDTWEDYDALDRHASAGVCMGVGRHGRAPSRAVDACAQSRARASRCSTIASMARS